MRTGAEVRRIEVTDGRATGVTVANGETLPADIVVCNADTAQTYKNLIDAKHRKVWSNAKVEAGKYSMNLLVWYFGTNKRY